MKLRRKDLVHQVGKLPHIKSPAQAEDAIVGFIEALATALSAGHSVTLEGLGTFTPKPRAARIARNPQTGEPVEVPAKTVIVFKASAKKGQ